VESGTVVAGRYRLDKPLKKGGMGQVWLGFDLREEIAVAVKLMRPEIAGPDLLERFKREAVVASSLRSPRILPVYDAGEFESQYFIIMKLLRGRDLGTVIADHRARGLPADQVVGLAIQLAGGLAAVHEKGIVHRDLKPDNLFMEDGEDGEQLVICDFGIARDNSKRVPVDYQWPVMGTPDYMSPEQCQGEPVGAASDLYATGCILYELLTGMPPFGDSPSAHIRMHRQVTEAPVPPCDRNPEVPGSLSDLALRLLAKDPLDRPSSAVEVGARLREIRDELHGQAVAAPLACVSREARHLELYALAGPGALWHRSFWPEPGWGAWKSMPLPAGRVSAVAAGSHDDEQQELAVAAGQAVYHRWWQDRDGEHWSEWAEMPALGAPVTDLALSSVVTGHLEIFALDSGGRIRHRWYGAEWFDRPGWSEWNDMEGPPAGRVSAIAVGSEANHHQEIFAVADGAVWHRWWWRGDGWSPRWGPMPGLPGRAADVASLSVHRMHLEVFALDDAGGLWHNWYWPRQDWSGWREMDAPAVGSPVTAVTAGSHSGRQGYLFAHGADGRVHYREFRLDGGDWSPWQEARRFPRVYRAARRSPRRA